MQSCDLRADYSGPVNVGGTVSESNKCSAGAVIQDFWKGVHMYKGVGGSLSHFLKYPMKRK